MKILAIDDELSIRRLIDRVFRLTAEVVLAGSGEVALSTLQKHTDIDVILLDISLPELDGLTLISEIRELDAHRLTPIILVTGDQRNSTQLKAFREGASDYISKPIDPELLKARVRVHYQNVLLRKRLEHEVATDTLTEVLNRRGLDLLVRRVFGRCARMQLSMIVVMLDIDYFKKFNDSFGHAIGDEVLRCLARELAGHFSRSTDIVGRMGGEEFLLVVQDANYEEVQQRVKTFRAEVRKLQLKDLDGNALPASITISVGGAELVPDGNSSFDMASLIEPADRALYEAKVTRDTACWAGCGDDGAPIIERESQTNP